MIGAVQYYFSRSYKWTILLKQMEVKRRADLLCLQESLRERRGFEIRHKASEIS